MQCGSSGTGAPCPGEGRVTGPLNLQELSFLVRRCIREGFFKLPGRVVPLPGNWRELDLDILMGLDLPIVTEEGGPSLLSAAI